MSFTAAEREILRELYEEVRTKGAYPAIEAFRARAKEEQDAIDSLGERGYLCTHVGRYQLTLRGLRAIGTPEAAQDLAEIARVLLVILRVILADADPEPFNLTVDEAAARFSMRPEDAARQLTFLEEKGFQYLSSFDASTGLITELICIPENVASQPPVFTECEEPIRDATEADGLCPILTSVTVDGYRALDGFRASLGALTVIIGSNAAGKSSLFDLFQFLKFGAQSPLPFDIDPNSAGKRLFHAAGPERIKIELGVTLQPRLLLRYAVEIAGPVGSPQIKAEELVNAQAPARERQHFLWLSQPTKRFVSRMIERGIVSGVWNLPPNELTLRRTLDPNLLTASAFQRYVSSWHLYTGFDVGPRSAIRRPAPTETFPTLADDGGNLSAVLLFLMTEHREEWEELEVRLRSAVPGFLSIAVKLRGGTGTAIGVWREEGVPGELTFADLSDGTLRLLCWAALCLSPAPPPLVCIDEPEIGLHPRVLPVLASLLRSLATRAQVIVATHSPYLLSQFDLEQIAVMRKEGGKAVFRRPADQEGLRRELEEIGSEELARMHISDELEVRS